MILGSYLIRKLREIDLYLPSDVFPVLAGISEFLRFWAFPAIRLSSPDRKNSSIHERENQITGRDLTNRFIKRISRTICVPFGRPEIAASYLVAICLVLVHPPITHSDRRFFRSTPRPQVHLSWFEINLSRYRRNHSQLRASAYFSRRRHRSQSTMRGSFLSFSRRSFN